MALSATAATPPERTRLRTWRSDTPMRAAAVAVLMTSSMTDSFRQRKLSVNLGHRKVCASSTILMHAVTTSKEAS